MTLAELYMPTCYLLQETREKMLTACCNGDHR